MTIQLTLAQEEFVRRQLSAGGYESASDVVDAALRKLAQSQDEWAGLEEVHAKIRRGIEQADTGRLSQRQIPEIIEACKHKAS